MDKPYFTGSALLVNDSEPWQDIVIDWYGNGAYVFSTLFQSWKYGGKTISIDPTDSSNPCHDSIGTGLYNEMIDGVTVTSVTITAKVKYTPMNQSSIVVKEEDPTNSGIYTGP